MNSFFRIVFPQEIRLCIHRQELKRSHQNCGQVFRYAVVVGRAEGDLASDVRGAISNAGARRMAVITDPRKISGLLRTIDDYMGSMQLYRIYAGTPENDAGLGDFLTCSRTIAGQGGCSGRKIVLGEINTISPASASIDTW